MGIDAPLPSRYPFAAPAPARWLPVGVGSVAVAAAAAVVAGGRRPALSAAVTVGAVVVAAVLAWRVGRQQRPWAAVAAAAVAGVGAVAGSRSDTWWAVTVAGVGLGVAAVVDAFERRVPTRVAHGTTVLSIVSLIVLTAGSSHWADLAVAVAGVIVLVYGSLWFARAVGFGDVRLAAATATAGTGGFGYVSAMLFTPAVIVGLAGLVQLVARRRVSALPMGPALVAGWLVALGSLPG